MRIINTAMLGGILCLSCGQPELQVAADQADIHGGTPSNVSVVQFVDRTDGKEKVTGNGVVVGPHHIATASAVFQTNETNLFDPRNNWSIKNQPAISYVVRSPRIENGTLYWDGSIAIAITVRDTSSQPVVLAKQTYEVLKDLTAYCTFELVGFNYAAHRSKVPYCLVARSFLQTDLYVDEIVQYYLSHGISLPFGFRDALVQDALRYDEASMFFVTLPSAFHDTVMEYKGSACENDLGSPIMDFMNETDDTDDVLVGIYLGNVTPHVGLNVPELPSCGMDAMVSVARGTSLFMPDTPLSPMVFIRRAVANCSADVTEDECKARILCDESQGDYLLEGDLCRPSCGKLAELRRTMLNEELIKQGKNPAAVPDNCALWCDNGHPALPFWSTPIELKPSHDCTRCLYYPPGSEPYPSFCRLDP